MNLKVKDVDKVRGHNFFAPESVLENIPKLYETDGITEKKSYIHYFVGDWDWHILELDPETQEAFALVFSTYEPNGEFGYVNLNELALVRAGLYKQPVERDLHFTPCILPTLRGVTGYES